MADQEGDLFSGKYVLFNYQVVVCQYVFVVCFPDAFATSIKYERLGSCASRLELASKKSTIRNGYSCPYVML